jgi:hypothetical protein
MVKMVDLIQDGNDNIKNMNIQSQRVETNT